MNHPLSPLRPAAQGFECSRLSVEAQLAFAKRFSQISQKHVSEPDSQHLNGEKERLFPATNPACPVRPDTAARNNAVEMRMKMKVLPPGMKHGQKANRRAQTFGISGNREQRFRRGAKQDAVNL